MKLRAKSKSRAKPRARAKSKSRAKPQWQFSGVLPPARALSLARALSQACEGSREAIKPYAAMFGAAVGAWLLVPVPLFLVLLVAGACLWRPGILLIFAVFASLTGFLGARAEQGLTEPSQKAVEGWVTLMDDPRSSTPRGMRATVRYEGQRYEVQAYGPISGRLDDVLAGEQLHITGTVKATASDWHRWRHIVGKIHVESVNEKASAAPLAALANSVRRVLARGAQSLSEDDRSLFMGMVYGDDREQSARLADDFKAAGLGHLLVVSGQNVAFVLALASPFAARLRPGTRLVVLLGVLGVFAVITRFEPSVLRAVAMAAAAVISTALGRADVGRSGLAWAISGVLVVDPFVLRMLAFQLSVCATAGLLWITPALAEALPGARSLRLALATTAGAQLAVMPLLIAVFERVPLASLAANVLAGPASGPVMMWGLTAGFGAGLLGGWAAWLVHLPTSVLLWWVRFVAARTAEMPPAMLEAASATIVVVGVALVLGARRFSKSGKTPFTNRHSDRTLPADGEMSITDGKTPFTNRHSDSCSVAGRSPLPVLGELSFTGGRSDGSSWESRRAIATAALNACGVGAVAAAFAYSFIGAATPPTGWSSAYGASVFSHDTAVVVVLDDPASPRRLLESLRLAGVRSVDLIVAADGDASDAHAVLALLKRYRGVTVVAPPLHRVPHARTVTRGAVIGLGELQGLITADSPEIVDAPEIGILIVPRIPPRPDGVQAAPYHIPNSLFGVATAIPRLADYARPCLPSRPRALKRLYPVNLLFCLSGRLLCSGGLLYAHGVNDDISGRGSS